MDDLNTIARTTAPREFVISHVFDAPRALVWKAWTEPTRLAQWWGPVGFTMFSSKLDLRPQGLFHYGMRSPQGQEMWGKFVFREIIAPERLVFAVSFSDQACHPCRHFASPTWPLEVLNTLMLAEHEGRTTLTLQGFPVNATDEECTTFEAARDSMQQGFSGTWNRLAAYLDNALEIAWAEGEEA